MTRYQQMHQQFAHAACSFPDPLSRNWPALTAISANCSNCTDVQEGQALARRCTCSRLRASSDCQLLSRDFKRWFSMATPRCWPAFPAVVFPCLESACGWRKSRRCRRRRAAVVQDAERRCGREAFAHRCAGACRAWRIGGVEGDRNAAPGRRRRTGSQRSSTALRWR